MSKGGPDGRFHQPNNSPWEETSTGAPFSFLRICTGWISSHPIILQLPVFIHCLPWGLVWFLVRCRVEDISFKTQNCFRKNTRFCITPLPLGWVLSTSGSGLFVPPLFHSKSCSIKDKTLESVLRTKGTKPNVSEIKIPTDLTSKIFLWKYSWSPKYLTTSKMLNGECKISHSVHSSANLNQDWFILWITYYWWYFAKDWVTRK